MLIGSDVVVVGGRGEEAVEVEVAGAEAEVDAEAVDCECCAAPFTPFITTPPPPPFIAFFSVFLLLLPPPFLRAHFFHFRTYFLTPFMP